MNAAQEPGGFVWFKHSAWIPVAGVLSIVNVVATWFAAQPGEPWHATIHALLAVVFGLGAQRLAARRQALMGGGAELPDITVMRGELSILRQAQSETLIRVEQAIDAIGIELERVGEGQRFLTKVLADPHRDSESSARPRQPDSIPLLRRPPPHEEL